LETTIAAPEPLTGGRRPPRRGRRVLRAVAGAAGALVAIAVVVGFFVHLPYVIVSPGAATPLNGSVVSIRGARTYPQRNPVSFLTVQVSTHDPNVWRVLTAKLDPDLDVQKRQDAVGCLSDQDNQTYNTELMSQSQRDATYVALTRLGYPVNVEPARVIVVEVCHGVPAAGRLRVGDQVVALEGQPVADVAALGPLVRTHHPGEQVTVRAVRDGTTVDTSVVLGRLANQGQRCVVARAGETGDACLGIASQDFVQYHFPVDVHIDTARVTGPSAGLAFTLSILDNLTPGDLIGTKRTAVTGEIHPDGTIGAVGGVEQKAITARANGVQLMIVPRSEVADARKGAGGVKVVGVDTLDEALAALQANGGAPLPPTISTAARS
jgi:PDZ domain-containing protein